MLSKKAQEMLLEAGRIVVTGASGEEITYTMCHDRDTVKVRKDGTFSCTCDKMAEEGMCEHVEAGRYLAPWTYSE